MSQEVMTNDEGGLDPKELDDMIEDLYRYQGALDRCNKIINKYNQTVP